MIRLFSGVHSGAWRRHAHHVGLAMAVCGLTLAAPDADAQRVRPRDVAAAKKAVRSKRKARKAKNGKGKRGAQGQAARGNAKCAGGPPGAKCGLGPDRAAAAAAREAAIGKDVVLQAMAAEMQRAQTGLSHEGSPAPYRVAYTVQDAHTMLVRAELGGAFGTTKSHNRAIHADVRIGSYADDSANFFAGPGRGVVRRIVTEDDVGAVRHALWLASDDAYKAALRSMSEKQVFLRDKNGIERYGDYTRAGPVVHTADVPAFAPDEAALKAIARRLSAELKAFPALQQSIVEVNHSQMRRRYLDSEGNLSESVQPLVQVEVVAKTQAEDGMELGDFVNFMAPRMDALPSVDAMAQAVRTMGKTLDALRTAPVIEDYDGPVLFEGAAAGQLMRVFLAGNLSGTPAPLSGSDVDASAFLRRYGRPVLPEGWAVRDAPSMTHTRGLALVPCDPARAGKKRGKRAKKRGKRGKATFAVPACAGAKVPLLGHYTVDHEGVLAEDVGLVKDGILKHFLMGRVPGKHEKTSNGHGRSALGQLVAARPSNLLVTPPKKAKKSTAKLKKELLRLAKREGYSYALIVRRLADPGVQGPLMPQTHGGGQGGGELAVPVPLEIVKVDSKGNETLVRGARAGGLQVRQLRDIKMVGKKRQVYNFMNPAAGVGRFSFGFGSGPSSALPTSLVTPDVLLPWLELKPIKGSTNKLPMIPAPKLSAQSAPPEAE